MGLYVICCRFEICIYIESIFEKLVGLRFFFLGLNLGLFFSGCDLVVFRERKEEEEGDGEEERVGLVVFIDRKKEGDGEEEVMGLVSRFKIGSILNLYLRSLWVCKFSFWV